MGARWGWNRVPAALGAQMTPCLRLPPRLTDILYSLLVGKYLQVGTPASLSGEQASNKNNRASLLTGGCLVRFHGN